jgi:NCS1 family nucleobase:cation symporter-1
MSEKAVVDGLVPEGYSDRLYNEDLAPAEERRWGSYSIFALWMSDVHNRCSLRCC